MDCLNYIVLFVSIKDVISCNKPTYVVLVPKLVIDFQLLFQALGGWKTI